MNKIHLIGRLVKNPDLNYTPNGIAVVNMVLAVTRPCSSKNPIKTDFFRITAWRNKAEYIGKYLEKGQKCAVTGYMQFDSFIRTDGSQGHSARVILEQVENLSYNGKHKDKDLEENKEVQPPKEWIEESEEMSTILETIDDDEETEIEENLEDDIEVSTYQGEKMKYSY